MTLRSTLFDDVYFSDADGLAESRHVYLSGNDLPAAWNGVPDFTIAETGFGTGLNFIAAWSAFTETAKPGQRLHYIGVERFPLEPADIRGALARWAPILGDEIEALLAQYPLRVPGFHRLEFGAVTLTLIFDDAEAGLSALVAPRGIDAWFLDGFTPKRNPEMWTSALFAQLARLSHARTTLATFTAVGAVRRRLAEGGFAVRRTPGFGTKWHMTRGHFTMGAPRPDLPPPGRVAILGGGLAGTAAAFMLRRSGIDVTLYEGGTRLAAAASGNAEGLCNPRLAARRGAQSDYYVAGWAAAVRLFETLPDIGWRRCGSLHLATTPERMRKLRGMATDWGWPADHMRLLTAPEASAQAGVSLEHEALWLPDAGAVQPDKLCGALADGTTIRLDDFAAPVAADGGWLVGGDWFAAVVHAGGARMAETLPDLPLHLVRGQITRVEPDAATSNLHCNLCYGGYIAPAGERGQWVGATFQRRLLADHPRPEDDADNIAKLAAALPGLVTMRPLGARVGYRVAARDHFPVVGALPTSSPAYVSAAHGSHGIVSSIAAAQLLADMLTGAPRSLSAGSIAALSPARFAKAQ